MLLLPLALALSPLALAEDGPQPGAVTEATFTCLKDWPAVGRTRFASVTDTLDDALAVARGERPGPYPAGTVVQIAPVEAMVKLAPGTSPDTDDWEYLKLKVTRRGVVIKDRGGAEVRNLAGSCHGCHTTPPQHDRVCMADHGCDPLPDFIIRAALKAVEGDPRCIAP